MSTNAEFYNTVMSVVGRSDDAVSRLYAVDAARRVLQNLDNSPFHPWFLEELASLPVTAAIDNVTLPSDFLDFREDDYVWFFPSSGADKEIVSRAFLEDLQDVYANQDSAALPEAFALAGSVMYLGPTPSEAGLIKFWYYKKTTAPADDSDEVSNVWLLNAEDFVAHLIGTRIARDKLRNTALAKELKDEATVLRAELFRMNEGRKHSNMDYKVNK